MNCVPSLPSPLAHAYLITGGSQEARRTYAEKMAAAYLWYRRAATLWPLPFL